MKTNYNIKYPRTYHHPLSETIEADDKRLNSLENFIGKPLTITIKMDGSNVGLSNKILSSRSGSLPSHQSFDLLKSKYTEIKYLIDNDMILYGEWLYAIHSIEYNCLPSYLQIFHILYNGIWLSWKEVKNLCDLMEIKYVQEVENNIIFNNLDDLTLETQKIAKKIISLGHEGIVIRLSNSFKSFKDSVCKYVRANHVQTSKHWTIEKIRKNSLLS